MRSKGGGNRGASAATPGTKAGIDLSKNFELLKRVERERESFEIPARSTAGKSSRYGTYSGQADESNWVGALGILRRNWLQSLTFLLAVVALVTVATYVMKGVYEPVAQLEVDPPGSDVVSLHDTVPSAFDPDYLQTQVEILSSDSLAIAVIRDLHLDRNTDVVSPKALQELGERAGTQTPYGTRLSPLEELALGAFTKKLSVSMVKNSRLIAISFASHDPRLAAQVANRLGQLYIERNFKTRYEAIQQLSHQLDDLREKIQESNRDLAQVQNASGIVNIDDRQQNTVTQKVLELSRQLTQAQGERIQLEAYLETAKAGGADALPQIRDNLLFQSLIAKSVDSRAQLAQALAVYGQNNPNVRKLQNDVDELEAQLAAERKRVLEELRTSYESSRARESMLAKALTGMKADVQGMNERSVQYGFLKKQAQANEDLYNALFARLKEAGIAAGLRSINIRFLDQARVLDKPTKPNRRLDIAVAILLGILGGVALPFLRENVKDTLSTPQDIRKWTGLSIVGFVPVLTRDGRTGRGLRLSRLAPRLPDGSSRSDRDPSGVRFFLEEPHSPESEAVRNLYASIRLSQPGKAPQVILVVSPSQGEGKTTLAVNLALAMAQHHKTCLVDADLRRPMVAQIFRLSSGSGLSNVLTETASLDQVLSNVPEVDNLTILASGAKPPNPGELVVSDSMCKIVVTLAERYESVVIDSPPLIPYADARALSSMVDGVILVGLCGSTTREAVTLSAQILEDVHAPLLGIVLNGMGRDAPYYRYYRTD